MNNDISKIFPYLFQFMGGYFYQSVLEFSDSEEAILDEYFSVQNGASWPVMGLWCDIQRMIVYCSDDLLKNFNELIEPSYIIGNNDAEAKTWLLAVATRCEAYIDQRTLSKNLFQV